MKKLIVSLFICLIAFQSQAEVIETNSYRDVLKYATADTLVVTDLDNTVIEPVQTLGSDQWGEAMGKKLLAAGFEKPQAVEMHVSMFALVQQHTKVKTVESDTAGIIENLKANNIPVLGLTARPVYIVDRTLDLLKSVNLNLTGLEEVAGIVQRHQNPNEIVYKSGVVFVGPMNNKGLVLKSIVDQLKNSHFNRIIFVDDKTHHTINVDKAFENSGIEVKSLRYGAADVKVHSYNAAIADFEWSHFLNTGIILSDKEASALMNKGLYSSDDVVVCDIPKKDYQAFVDNGFFVTESLQTEGFIHCAKPSQLPYVVNKYFVEDEYAVFVSRKDMLGSELVYEGKDPNNLYPHLRRAFKQSDLIATFFMKRNANGQFEIPVELQK
jgi:uncharacterized protein (DUF952 family)